VAEDLSELFFVHEGAVEEVVDRFPWFGLVGDVAVAWVVPSGEELLGHPREVFHPFVLWRCWSIWSGICGRPREQRV
jgi:hypothetical protein